MPSTRFARSADKSSNLGIVCLFTGVTLVLEATKFTQFPQLASTLIYTTAKGCKHLTLVCTPEITPWNRITAPLNPEIKAVYSTLSAADL